MSQRYPLEALDQSNRTWKLVGLGSLDHRFPAVYEGRAKTSAQPCFITVNKSGKSQDGCRTLIFPIEIEIEDWRL